MVFLLPVLQSIHHGDLWLAPVLPWNTIRMIIRTSSRAEYRFNKWNWDFNWDENGGRSSSDAPFTGTRNIEILVWYFALIWWATRRWERRKNEDEKFYTCNDVLLWAALRAMYELCLLQTSETLCCFFPSGKRFSKCLGIPVVISFYGNAAVSRNFALGSIFLHGSTQLAKRVVSSNENPSGTVQG